MPPIEDPKKSSFSEWAKYVGGMIASIIVGGMISWIACVQTYGERIVRVEASLQSLTCRVDQLTSVVWEVRQDGRGGGGQ